MVISLSRMFYDHMTLVTWSDYLGSYAIYILTPLYVLML